MEDGLTSIGVRINGVVYTCTGTGAPADILTSLILNVTGTYVCKCIHAYIQTHILVHYMHISVHT